MGENVSLLSMGLMRLQNKKEVLIVGGNAQMVIFNWEEGELVEFHREDYKNVVEIYVCDNWFAIKYKKKRAKLFRMLPEDQDIELDGSWSLGLRPFTSNYRTLMLGRFRKNQLLIADSSHKSKGVALQLEIFDVKRKETVALEDVAAEGKSKITGVLFTSKFRKLAIFDEDRFMKVFEFEAGADKPDETGAKLRIRKNFKSTGSICRALLNKLSSFFIIGTTSGEIFFYDAEKLEEDTVLHSKRHIVDISVFDQRRRTMVYVLHRDTKDFVLFLLEPALGNLLLDRYSLLNPVYTAGGLTRRKEHEEGQH